MRLLKPIMPSGSEQSIDGEMGKRKRERKEVRAFSLAAGKAGRSEIETAHFSLPLSPRGQWPWEQPRSVPGRGCRGGMDTGHRTQPGVNRDTGMAPGPSGAFFPSKKRRETIIRNERLGAALGMAAHPMEHPERALGCRGRSFNLCRLQPSEPYPHIPWEF